MAKESIRLKCLANASVEGNVVPAGDIREWSYDLAQRLLSSNRFAVTDESPKLPAKPKAKPVAKKSTGSDD
jgi:hypothetical protein